MKRKIPSQLEEIPAGYLKKATEEGRVEVIEYDTWDAFGYFRKDRPIRKMALVYLPYGYNGKKKYNIFYLMHGGGGSERTYLGEHTGLLKNRFHSYGFKNIIDNAVGDGKIDPVIIVCPTYNNESDEDSWDYELALRLTSLYPQELINDLIPVVESRYSTYAEDVTPTGLENSRDHRGFGGFSMGSVTAWHVFEHCLKYFRYFIMMSGNCGDGTEQDAAVKQSGLTKEDFFIFAATGTADFAHSAFRSQIMNMGHRYTDSFCFADTQEEGNLSYREKAGAAHDYKFANLYIYNGLRFFWGAE